MRLNFLIATMRISSSQDIICIMLWLTSYIFSDFVLFYFCGDSCLIPYKSLPPSVSRPMTVLKWQTHGSPCPSLCLFSPSASTYYTMLMSVSTTVYELIERRLYITASFHQTELGYTCGKHFTCLMMTLKRQEQCWLTHLSLCLV